MQPPRDSLHAFVAEKAQLRWGWKNGPARLAGPSKSQSQPLYTRGQRLTTLAIVVLFRPRRAAAASPIVPRQKSFAMLRSRRLLVAALVLCPLAPARAQAPLPMVRLTVSPLFFVTRAGAAPGEAAEEFGECRDFELILGGSAPGNIRIGVTESVLGGAGQLWTASLWQAALIASQFSNFNPLAQQATLTVAGNIDGPSAGALLTVGVLSGLHGHQINPQATMTGTINPDGEVGPVGGIPYKIEGAARAGKKIVLIPAINRFEVDKRTGKSVDLIEHGRANNVEVRLVKNLWQAYRELTGQDLPRSPAAEAPVLPSAAIAHLAKRIPLWRAHEESARNRYNEWRDIGQNDLADERFDEAETYRARSSRLESQGQIGPAYWDAVWAAAVAWAGHEVGRCEYAFQTSGLDGMRRVVADDGWLRAQVDKTAAAMRFFRPTTFEQMAVYLSACDAFFEGLCFQALAATLRDKPNVDDDTANQLLVVAAEQQTIAWMDMNLALDLLTLADSYGGTPIPATAPVDDLAEFYYASARAGQAVVDEVMLKELMKATTLSEAEVRSALVALDPVYSSNMLGLNVIYPQLSRYFGEGPQLAYARLAAGMGFHQRSALLIAKYYSLGLELDEDLNVVGVTNEPGLNDWLDDSEDQARRAIGALVAANIDHTTCTQIYEIGRIYAGRELVDRIDALDYFFQANITAQVLKHLAQSGAPAAAP
jgi:hypothetical protein